MNPPSLARLGLTYLRIVNCTFGGGDPTMAALQHDLVTRRGWLPPDRFALAYTLARLTPGTNVLAFCAGSAWLLRGGPGALLSVVAASVPCAVMVVWLTWLYEAVKVEPAALAALAAVLAAAVGLMVAGAWLLVQPFLPVAGRVRGAFFVAAPAFLLLVFGLSPVAILACAALLGLLWPEPRG